jgi:hypothetical protein
VGAGIALLVTSQWLHAPSVEYLIPLLVATAATAAVALRVTGAPRRWAIGSTVGLIAVAAIASASERGLWRTSHAWETTRREASSRGLSALQRALDDATADATRAAAAGLDVQGDRTEAFDQLATITRPLRDGGVVVFQGDSAYAWAGDFRAPIDHVHDSTTIVATPFYLALQVSQRRGKTKAIVAVLLDAAPPGDRFVSTLAQPIADRAGLREFKFLPPIDIGGGAEVLRYTSHGLRLFNVAAVPLTEGEVAQRIAEMARARAGIAFVIALVCFVIGVWRATRIMAERGAALAVALACVALVPLNQYSNLGRLFDPSVYFMARGGPLTGNAAALATTSAIVLLGVLAVFRRGGRRTSRWAAIITRDSGRFCSATWLAGFRRRCAVSTRRCGSCGKCRSFSPPCPSFSRARPRARSFSARGVERRPGSRR